MKKTRQIIIHTVVFTVVCFVGFSFRINLEWKEVKSDFAAKELIELNKNILKNERYSFKVKYTSFKEHDAHTAYESQNGYVVKDGVNLYSRINGAITVQNSKLRVVVDSAKQFIKVTDPLEGVEPNFNVNDYIKVLATCKAVKRKEENQTIAYRFEPKGGRGIVAQEIYLSQDFLTKSVIYYANEYSTRENNEIITETVYPKLEITISDFKKLEKVGKDSFKTDAILALDGKKIILKDKYKSYKVFDGRIKK